MAPIYEYKCPDCGKIVESNMRDLPPKCRSHSPSIRMIRLYRPPAIAFKGGGFTRSTGA